MSTIDELVARLAELDTERAEVVAQLRAKRLELRDQVAALDRVVGRPRGTWPNFPGSHSAASLPARLLARLASEPERMFRAKDFGEPDAMLVAVTLSRLRARGEIERVGRGLYQHRPTPGGTP